MCMVHGVGGGGGEFPYKNDGLLVGNFDGHNPNGLLHRVFSGLIIISEGPYIRRGGLTDRHFKLRNVSLAV